MIFFVFQNELTSTNARFAQMESKIHELYDTIEQQNAHITSLKEENAQILESQQPQQQQAQKGSKLEDVMVIFDLVLN